MWGPQTNSNTSAEASVEIFHVPIDEADFSASGTTVAPPGPYYMWVFAGPPPCDGSFMPVCGGSFRNTEFFCMTAFDVRPNEDIRISIAGLPEKSEDETEDIPPPCAVWLWERGSWMNLYGDGDEPPA